MFEYKILPMGSSLNFEYELGDSLDDMYPESWTHIYELG